MPSTYLILCHPLLLLLQSFPKSGSFPMSRFCASDGQCTGVSASASFLPMNFQDWFPLGLTVFFISLQSKGFSRVFSNTTIQKHQLFGSQPSLFSIFGMFKTFCHFAWHHPSPSVSAAPRMFHAFFSNSSYNLHYHRPWLAALNHSPALPSSHFPASGAPWISLRPTWGSRC